MLPTRLTIIELSRRIKRILSAHIDSVVIPQIGFNLSIYLSKMESIRYNHAHINDNILH